MNRTKTSIGRIVLPEGFITPIPIKYDAVETVQETEHLIPGQLYKLRGEECEGFEMPTRVYMCKGIFKELEGIPLNAVLMKLVEGEEDSIYSLTRLDCKLLNVDYETKLQLFPDNFDWQQVAEIPREREFDVANLGTYKPSTTNGKIKLMHVFLNGIRLYNRKSVQTPASDLVNSVNSFLGSIMFTFKNIELQRRFPIVAKPIVIGNESAPFFDARKDGINFMLFFGEQGIDPSVFEGYNIDSLIEVSWNAPYSRTEAIIKESWVRTEEELNRSRAILNNIMNSSSTMTFGMLKNIKFK